MRRAADGKPHRAVVVPLRSDLRLRYQDWVAGRRQFVRERSDGRAGYLHVPDMVSEGWSDFHRDLRGEMEKEALIVDVRANSGGHTSQLVVEKLARRVIGWDTVRHGRPQSYPVQAPRGPVVAVTDEWAGSDGDIVTGGDQDPEDRHRDRRPHLGRRDRHRGLAPARRRHVDDDAQVLLLVQPVRLGRGELRRRPGHRAADDAERLGLGHRSPARAGGRTRDGIACRRACLRTAGHAGRPSRQPPALPSRRDTGA